MVRHMGADVMVNPIDETVVPIDRRQRSLQEVPVIAAIPRNILFRMVQIRHQIQPHHKPQVGHEVKLEEELKPVGIRQPTQERHKAHQPSRAGQTISVFRRFE